MPFIILLIGILVVFVSCNQHETKTFTSKKIRKSIKLNLDSTTSVSILTNQYIENKHHLALLNTKNNSLVIYDLSSYKKVTEIKFELDGENAVGKVNNFLYINQDSIFLLNSYAYKLFLVNYQGKILRKYSLIRGKIGDNTSLPMVFPFNNPMVFLDNRYLYISATPDRNPNTKFYYQAKNLSIKLDLIMQNYTYEPFWGYPSNYQKNFYPDTYHLYSRIFIPSTKQWLYSFFACDSLYTTNGKSFYASSDMIGKIISFPKPITNSYENNQIANQNNFFTNIYYDPYRETFYRVAILQNPNQNNEQKFLIIILNKDIKKIQEIIFRQSEGYNLLNVFFTPEGMWIQRITDNEDELVYDLVEFVSE